VRRIILIALSVVAFGGCASITEPNHTIKQNTIASGGYPSANIVVSEKFRYGGTEAEYGRSFGDAANTSSTSVKNTMFGFQDNSRSQKRVLLVQFFRISKLGWNFLREPEISGIGVIFNEVPTTIGDMESYSRFFEGGGLFGSSANNRDCGVGTTIRQIPSGMRQHKLRITYAEEISCDTFHQYQYVNGGLTQTGRIRLEKVLDRALDSFAIVPKD